MSLEELRKRHLRVVHPRDEVWDALCRVTGADPDGSFTATARSVMNRMVKELKAAEATPDEIERRARRYRAVYPDCVLTPGALVKHWPALYQPRSVPICTDANPERECAEEGGEFVPMPAEAREALRALGLDPRRGGSAWCSLI